VDPLWTQLGLVLALVLLNAVFAGSEMALVSLRQGQIRQLERRGGSGAVLARLARDPNRFLATIQIGITLAGFLASASAAVTLAEPLVEPLSGLLGGAARPAAVGLVTIAVSYVTLVLGEMAPKRIAMQRAERWGLVVARPLALLSRLARPAVWLVGTSSDLVVRALGGDPARHREEVSEEELRDMVAAQPTLTRDERTIVTGAFEFADRTLRQILVPRHQVVALPADLPAAEAVPRLAAAGHTRAPVYGRDLDDIRGTASLRVLVGAEGTVGEHAQEPVILPETMGALAALRVLQRERQQLAVVVDEHGATQGVITVEDLVEELVGEIWDEDDPDVRGALRHPDGSVTVVGTFPVHDLPDVGISLPTGDYATVAGLVLERLGRLPSAGERLTVAGCELTVLAATDRAVTRVKITPLDQPSAPEPVG